MGFLTESEPLDWAQAINRLHYVREHGVEQFMHIFHAVKHVNEDLLRWGDEVEHAIFTLVGGPEDEDRSVRILLQSPEVISEIERLEKHGRHYGLSEADMCSWMPEYGRWMLESTPRKPYEGLIDLLKIEDRMRMRRSRLLTALGPCQIAPTVSCLPNFGVGDFSEPLHSPGGPIIQSLFVPDEVIFPHARFHTLTKNIRQRRGSKVEIRRPRFEDQATPKPTICDPTFVPSSVEEADSMDHVYADAMAFGMGCCCLQVTFQAKNMSESRHLYDHLSVLTPIMLALTASTPFMRGWLIDEDCRWNSVAQAVDDRTPAERGVVGDSEADARLVGNGKRFLRKSRYDSIDCYLCNCSGGKRDPAQIYNDLSLACSEEDVQRLLKGGIDEVLARHVAHLFVRDPLVIFKDRIELDDRMDIDHWENLQSTNWQTVRWKPPPPQKGVLANTSEEHIGWRVEFRSMEIQVTDFENAAFSVFIMLLSRVVLVLELSLYIPISRLEENMRTAQRREACTKERFWFRKCVLPADYKFYQNTRSTNPSNSSSTREQGRCQVGFTHPQDVCELMSLAEILGGKDSFPGLIPLCDTYLDFIGCDSVIRSGLQRYMKFILRRAQGELLTPATWMRQFITTHRDYKKDSRIPSTTAYDLMVACSEIGAGARDCPELLGDIKLPKVEPAAQPDQQPARKCSEHENRLLDHLRQRAKERQAAALDQDIMKKTEEVKRCMEELQQLRDAREGAHSDTTPV